MKNLSCCSMSAGTARGGSQAADGKAHPPRVARQRFAWVKCSLPTLILALLPKCPACFAAYVALGTGVSLSVAAASVVRTLLIGACVGTLVCVIASTLRSGMRRRRSSAASLRWDCLLSTEARRRGENLLVIA